MWISQHRWERMESELRRLDAEVDRLKRLQYCEAGKGGAVFPAEFGERNGVPLFQLISVLAQKAGVEWDITPASWCARLTPRESESHD